jgi:hypothetical protein
MLALSAQPPFVCEMSMKRLTVFFLLLLSRSLLLAQTNPPTIQPPSIRPEQYEEVSNALFKFIGQNALAFAQPLFDGFITNLNSGYISRTRTPSGFYISARLSLMGATIPESQRTFNVIPLDEPFSITEQGATLSGRVRLAGEGVPTIVGLSRRGIITRQFSDLTLNGNPIPDTAFSLLPPAIRAQLSTSDSVGGGAENIAVVPFLVPQFSIGAWNGTELTVRFIPQINQNGLKAGMFGGAIRHSLSQYDFLKHATLFRQPLDISAMLSYQSARIEFGGENDPVKITSLGRAFALIVSTAFKLWRVELYPYTALALEGGSVTVNYTSSNQFVGTQNLEFIGTNTARLTLGGQLKIYFFTLNLDINTANVSGFALSAGVEL